MFGNHFIRSFADCHVESGVRLAVCGVESEPFDTLVWIALPSAGWEGNGWKANFFERGREYGRDYMAGGNERSIFINHESSSDNLESRLLCTGRGIANEANNRSDGSFSQCNRISGNSRGLRGGRDWSQEEQASSGTIPNNSPMQGCAIGDLGDGRHIISNKYRDYIAQIDGDSS
jgi:hypothetical protein